MSKSDAWLRFVLASLATWRITHLLAREDGPGDVLALVRARLGNGITGKLMDCFDCLSAWVAVPMSCLAWKKNRLLGALGLSGAACILQRAVQERVLIQRLAEISKGGSDDGMLRPETSSSPERSTAGGNNKRQPAQ